jgi:hypothetical protein
MSKDSIFYISWRGVIKYTKLYSCITYIDECTELILSHSHFRYFDCLIMSVILWYRSIECKNISSWSRTVDTQSLFHVSKWSISIYLHQSYPLATRLFSCVLHHANWRGRISQKVWMLWKRRISYIAQHSINSKNLDYNHVPVS